MIACNYQESKLCQLNPVSAMKFPPEQQQRAHEYATDAIKLTLISP